MQKDKQDDPIDGMWLSFQLATEHVERRRGISSGAAQKAVLDACEKGTLRWRNSRDGGPDVWNVSFWLWVDPRKTERRASPKRDLANLAIRTLWPNGVPGDLLNKQVEAQMANWITAHCMRENIPTPSVSRDVMLRAAGRKK
jgi:hypothetical protein